MNSLPHVVGERMSPEMKTKWAEIAKELGPDCIDQFRKVGAFMAAIERF